MRVHPNPKHQHRQGCQGRDLATAEVEDRLAGFVEAIRTGRTTLASGMDGLKAQEVVQAAYISQRERRWVDLPLLPDAPFTVPDYR